MFGKMMNNFYYGKSGKGDYRKEDLPTNRWQLFWEMLRVRFSALMRLNLLYMLVWLPTMIVLLLTAFGMLTSLGQMMDPSSLEEGAAPAFTSVAQLFSSMSMTALVLLVPCIAITGPFTAGLSYVTRNWARDEHAFIWSDFKDAVKDNWKQALAVSTINGIAPLLAYVCWTFYGDMTATNGFMIVPQVLTMMVALVWALSITYLFPLMVSYKLKFKDLLRNGVLLAIARLPQSFAIRLLHLVPLAIAAAAAFLVNALWAVLGLLAWYVLFGFGLSRFITASYTNGVFDKYINPHIEGAQVNRGLNTEVDDDDDDEEYEDDEEA